MNGDTYQLFDPIRAGKSDVSYSSVEHAKNVLWLQEGGAETWRSRLSETVEGVRQDLQQLHIVVLKGHCWSVTTSYA
jgi:hypothetical protein